MPYLIDAEQLINQPLNIFERYNHPDHYASLESLAELYAQKSINARKDGNYQKARKFKQQAIKSLEQSLAVVAKTFMKDSAHIVRIEKKLINAQKISVI